MRMVTINRPMIPVFVLFLISQSSLSCDLNLLKTPFTTNTHDTIDTAVIKHVANTEGGTNRIATAQIKVKMKISRLHRKPNKDKLGRSWGKRRAVALEITRITITGIVNGVEKPSSYATIHTKIKCNNENNNAPLFIISFNGCSCHLLAAYPVEWFTPPTHP